MYRRYSTFLLLLAQGVLLANNGWKVLSTWDFVTQLKVMPSTILTGLQIVFLLKLWVMPSCSCIFRLLYIFHYLVFFRMKKLVDNPIGKMHSNGTESSDGQISEVWKWFTVRCPLCLSWRPNKLTQTLKLEASSCAQPEYKFSEVCWYWGKCYSLLWCPSKISNPADMISLRRFVPGLQCDVTQASKPLPTSK